MIRYMNYLNKVKSYISLHRKLAIVLAILLIIAIIWTRNNNKQNADLYTVKRGDITESIEVSGKVKASAESNLNFERSGVISQINVKVGQKVYKGQTLAALSSQDLIAQVSQAQAAVESANANLNSIIEGARPEEIALKQQALDSAKSDLTLQNSQAIDTYTNVLNTYNDIIFFKLNNLFVQNGDSYKYNINNCDQSLASNIESSYQGIISNFKTVNAVTDYSSPTNILAKARDLNNDIKSLVTSLSNAVTASCVANDSSLNTARTYVSAAKTNLITATTELNTRVSLLNTTKNAVDRAEKDLTLVKAGGDKNKIDIQKAALSQAKAALESAEAQLNKNILRAPFDGLITAVDIDLGELAINNKAAISMMSDNNFELELKLSEIDAAKLTPNSAADITLDAYGNDIHWPGAIVSIDPSATDNNGVANYKAKIAFNNSENMDKVRAGMTANARIIISQKSNTLSIPSKYLRTAEGKTTVTRKSGNKFEETEVSIGLRSDDGNVEIVKGVSEGDVLQMIGK